MRLKSALQDRAEQEGDTGARLDPAREWYRDRSILMHDLWIWDPKKGMDGWALVSNNVWGCEDHPERDGKSDFMLEIHNGKLWTLGGDREVISPWPQDNDVWTADLPTN